MSTRATYRFDSEHACRRSTTLYIHHDGCPSGAALYLYKALSEDVRGGMPERMIRANDDAELTENHELHGDTEYRYTVTGSGAGAAILALAEAFGFSEVVAEVAELTRQAGGAE